jgi:pyrrolysine biosynthesis protein PylC
MRIGVVGGRLQGLEAVYLAQMAGFQTTLLDKVPQVPARFIAEDFYLTDINQEEEKVRDWLKGCDLIIPATENFQTLVQLNEMAHQVDVPLALDLPSLTLSASKIHSNKILSHAGISLPAPWPGCTLPVIVKPSNFSGSIGVRKVADPLVLRTICEDLGNEMVIQEYVEGPSYSLEVVANKGKGTVFQVTLLEFDAGFDCKRVIAGPNIGKDIVGSFHQLGEEIAVEIRLSGIMDIEVIKTGKDLKVLEIDARLPSQTPTVVYHSTGINFIQILVEYWVNGRLPDYSRLTEVGKGVLYEHFQYTERGLAVTGEHILTTAQGLRLYTNRFGADVLISNFEQSPENWVATAIFLGETEEEIWRSHYRAIQQIQEAFNCPNFYDLFPGDEV